MPEVIYIGLPALLEKGVGAIVDAVGEGAEDLAGRCQDVTPVDTGTLKASIHVDGPDGAGYTVTARVQTGGEANEYAIFVHEGTRYMAGRKFIEGPLIAFAPTFQAYVAKAAAGAF